MLFHGAFFLFVTLEQIKILEKKMLPGEVAPGSTFQTGRNAEVDDGPKAALLKAQTEDSSRICVSEQRTKKARYIPVSIWHCFPLYVYISIPLILLICAFPIVAFFYNDAGPTLHANNMGCTHFPSIFIALFGVEMFSFCVVLPFSCCSEEKPSEPGNVSRGCKGILCGALFTLSFTWCMEYVSIFNDDECVDFIQNKGSNIFWLCCTIYFYFFCFNFATCCLFTLRWFFCCDPDGCGSIL